MKMKYKPDDFRAERIRDTKPVVINLDMEDHAALKNNASRLGVSLTVLVRRCLKDAGVFSYETQKARTEEVEDDSVDRGSEESD